MRKTSAAKKRVVGKRAATPWFLRGQVPRAIACYFASSMLIFWKEELDRATARFAPWKSFKCSADLQALDPKLCYLLERLAQAAAADVAAAQANVREWEQFQKIFCQ